MGAIRKTKTGRFELCLSNKLLPKRLFFTFDSAEAAQAYSDEAEKWLAAGVVPVAVSAAPIDSRLTVMVQSWRNTGRLSKTDDDLLGWLVAEPMIRDTMMTGLTYVWAESWVLDMKMRKRMAPSSIRQRVQAISRALDWYLRSNPSARVINPLKLLPRGYSVYSEQEGAVVEAKRDQIRDRRLHPGEADQIRAVLRGEVVPEGRERGIPLPDGVAMLNLFEVILHTGLRLREAYMIRKENISGRVVKVLTTKQRNGNVAYREVPIRPEIYKLLTTGRGLLFPFWDGDPKTLTQTSNRLSHRFHSVFEHAKCSDLKEHDLRHEATCQWFELRDSAGHWMFRPEEINKIMGWAPGSTMAARYASFRASSLAERLWA